MHERSRPVPLEDTVIACTLCSIFASCELYILSHLLATISRLHNISALKFSVSIGLFVSVVLKLVLNASLLGHYSHLNSAGHNMHSYTFQCPRVWVYIVASILLSFNKLLWLDSLQFFPHICFFLVGKNTYIYGTCFLYTRSLH